MVDGIDLFGRHFADFADRYAVIGGAACEALMESLGVPFRATRDVDMVICAETLDSAFRAAFWTFIRDGQYTAWRSQEGIQHFYRFENPQVQGYPSMIELFARQTGTLVGREVAGTIGRLAADESVSRLSAILLNDEYYKWTFDGVVNINGISVVRAEHLIPLKARAWLDLSSKREKGEGLVRASDIKKHKNDVFRLYAVASPEYKPVVGELISSDMREFITKMEEEEIDFRNLGLVGMKKESALESLALTYLTRS